MSIKAFLKLAEIQTKVASVFPFLIGTAIAKYRYDVIKPVNVLLMLISLICIDMATTCINNYMDYKKAIKKEGYGFEKHNAIVRYNLSETSVVVTIIVLLTIAVTSGIALVLHSDELVLLLGIISFFVGIVYSFGPIPISRTPFGEIFSGFFMGGIITFISVYIHIFDQGIFIFMINNWEWVIRMNVKEILLIFLMSFPMMVGIANIMLANNLCDLDDDIVNKRYTLVFYIGKKTALLLYETIYYVAFFMLILLMILRVLPFTSLLALITIVPIYGFIQALKKKQVKSETFVLSVKSFVLLSGVYLISITLGIVVRLVTT